MLAILIFGIFGAVVGVALGSRFRVFVLGPAILLISAAAIIDGIASGYDPHTIGVAILAILASMQFGYIAGYLVAQYLPERTKLPRRTWMPSQHH